MNNTYECEICYAVNHAKKTQCSPCGTIPSQYSLSKKPARLFDNVYGDVINGSISVVAAHGVDRTERHRYAKRMLRTVPMDYYAGCE